MISSRIYADLFESNHLSLVEKLFERSNEDFQKASRHNILEGMVNFLESLLEINGIQIVPFLCAIHDILSTTHLCDEIDGNADDEEVQHDENVGEDVREEDARTEYLKKISKGRNLKKNCLFLYGSSDAGKSMLANILTSGHQCTSLVQTSKSFALATLVGPYNCVVQHELKRDMDICQLKLILAGKTNVLFILLLGFFYIFYYCGNTIKNSIKSTFNLK